MTNMSYCRFQNTARDLQDCYDHLNDDLEDMDEAEREARQWLIELCRDIVNEAVTEDEEESEDE